VSYENVGLYLTEVTMTDTAGHTYKDTAIVNVLDASVMFATQWQSIGSKEINLSTDSTGRSVIIFIIEKIRMGSG
jgi:hypothetical protein